MSLHSIHDVWSSHLQGASFLLGSVRRLGLSCHVLIEIIIRTGANKKAIYFKDIDLPSYQSLSTYSDVFAVSQQDVRLLLHFRRPLSVFCDILESDLHRRAERINSAFRYAHGKTKRP